MAEREGERLANLGDRLRKVETRVAQLADHCSPGIIVHDDPREGDLVSSEQPHSDANILREISQQLVLDERLDCCDVSVEVQARHATLEGRVPSREMKELLEAMVAGTPGVLDIDSRIRIEREPHT
jgi:RecA-family ATPase